MENENRSHSETIQVTRKRLTIFVLKETSTWRACRMARATHKMKNWSEQWEKAAQTFTLLQLIYVHMEERFHRNGRRTAPHARTQPFHSRWRLLILYCQQPTINEDNKIFFNYVKWKKCLPWFFFPLSPRLQTFPFFLWIKFMQHMFKHLRNQIKPPAT